MPIQGPPLIRALLLSGLFQKVDVGQSILELRVKTYQQLMSGAEFYQASRGLGMGALRFTVHILKPVKAYLNEADGDWESYVAGVLVDVTWGDHITLQALSDCLQVGIRVFSVYVGSEHRDYCLDQQVSLKSATFKPLLRIRHVF